MNTFTNILMIILILLLSALIAIIVVGSLKISAMMNDMFNKELPDCLYKMPQDDIENIAEYFVGTFESGLYDIKGSELQLNISDLSDIGAGTLEFKDSITGNVLPNAGLPPENHELTKENGHKLTFDFEKLINDKGLSRDSNAFAEGEHNKVPMLSPMDAFTATCKIN
jgi:hypothetical protein